MHEFTRKQLAGQLRRLERGSIGAPELCAWAAEVMAAEPVFEDEIDRESLSERVLRRLAASPLPSSVDLPELIGIVESLPCQHYAAMERLERWLRDAAAQ